MSSDFRTATSADVIVLAMPLAGMVYASRSRYSARHASCSSFARSRRPRLRFGRSQAACSANLLLQTGDFQVPSFRAVGAAETARADRRLRQPARPSQERSQHEAALDIEDVAIEQSFEGDFRFVPIPL